jgi:hypothetical protein
MFDLIRKAKESGLTIGAFLAFNNFNAEDTAIVCRIWIGVYL